MKLIVGLGNPGKEYENTRHNMGFSVIDRFLEKNNLELTKEAFKGKYLKTKLFNEDIIILKPLTFMNLSGECVREFVHYFKIDFEDLIVVYDDMDLPAGKIRLREKGSSGGQKGMKNIIELLHSEEINRIRIGIGKADKNVVDYVLTKPSKDDEMKIKEAREKACSALECFIKFGFKRAKEKYF